MSRAISLRTWALLLGAWTVVALLLTRLHFTWHVWVESPISVGQAFARGFGDAYLWALVTAVAVWITRRFPLTRSQWWKAVAIHIAVGLVLPVVRYAAYLLILGIAGGMQGGYRQDVFYFEMFGPYIIIVGIVNAVVYNNRRRDRELAAHSLEAELATARLHRLKSQLHPHFLFNTLHAISSLMYTDVKAADRGWLARRAG